MYQVKPSTRAHQRRASIIPVELIHQSAHLLPVFPKSVLDTEWDEDNVYDKAKSFFVNPLLRHYDFARFNEALSLTRDDLPEDW